MGNTEKALEYARQAPITDITQDHLLSMIQQGEPAVSQIQNNLYAFVYLMYNQITWMVDKGSLDAHGRRKAGHKLLQLFDWLYEDGDYGFFATRLADIHYDLAFHDANDTNKEGTLHHLAKAAEHAVQFVTQGNYPHTSFLANRTHFESGQGYPNAADNDMQRLLKHLQHPAFDFVRGDARFSAIQTTIENHM